MDFLELQHNQMNLQLQLKSMIYLPRQKQLHHSLYFQWMIIQHLVPTLPSILVMKPLMIFSPLPSKKWLVYLLLQTIICPVIHSLQHLSHHNSLNHLSHHLTSKFSSYKPSKCHNKCFNNQWLQLSLNGLLNSRPNQTRCLKINKRWLGSTSKP